MTQTNKEHLLKEQGYYYQVKIIWLNHPEKIIIHEYGNEIAANKAAKYWNSMPDCKIEIEKRYN